MACSTPPSVTPFSELQKTIFEGGVGEGAVGGGHAIALDVLREVYNEDFEVTQRGVADFQSEQHGGAVASRPSIGTV